MDLEQHGAADLLDVEAAALDAQEGVGDRELEAEAAVTGQAMEAAAGEVELLRGRGLDGGGDVDLEAERGVVVAGAELDGDRARGQALAGEQQQVLERLDEVARVDEGGGQTGRGLHAELDLLAGADAGLLHGAGDQRCERHGLGLELDPAGLDAGHVEDRVDLLQEVLAGVGDRLDHLALVVVELAVDAAQQQ